MACVGNATAAASTRFMNPDGTFTAHNVVRNALSHARVVVCIDSFLTGS